MGVPITWVSHLKDFDRFPWRDTGGFYCPDDPDGAAMWEVRDGYVRQLIYVCPCGCKDWRAIPIKPHGGPHGWQWDENPEKPSIVPSIQHIPTPRRRCAWHGYITKGEFVTSP